MDNDLNELREIATQRVDEVNMRVETVFNFVQGALTIEQLDRVIDLMHNCGVHAQFILNQPPPPPPQQPLEGVDDNMDEAESGTTDA